MEERVFIIDFDSTFVTLESLDELACISLMQNPQKEAILAQIKGITQLGMEGKLTFDQSLFQRISLFKTNKKYIEQLVALLSKNITPSILRNKAFFKKNHDQIYVISGGFKEYVIPIVKKFGIDDLHVLANEFIFDKKDNVTGFKKDNPLSKSGGKVKAIRSLQLTGEVLVIGDGYTDYEIKKKGAASKFYAFTESVRRDSVVHLADYEVRSFDEVLFDIHAERAQSYPKSKMKVLLLENIDMTAIRRFEQEGYHVITMKKALDEQELAKVIGDVSIIGIRSKTELTRDVLKAAKKLMAIGAFCIGTNQIDLSSATDFGVAVFNAPFSNTRSVVELVIGEIIMLYRQATDKSNKLHQGVWDKSAVGSREIRGKKLGIIGYGNIGTQLSVVAESLGMQVYFYDIQEKLALGNAKKCSSMKELLKTVDVVTVHVDGRKENVNLIGEKEFAIMRDGVIFLNLSRGFVVNIKVLAQAIQSGKVRGAAIDVFPQEPKSNDEPFVSELQKLPNVILTPHIGGSTEEAQRNIGEFVSERLTRYIDDGSTTLSANFPVIERPRNPKLHRFIHVHQNKPGVLAHVNSILAKHKINIEAQSLGTNGQIGYVVTDVNKNYREKVIKELQSIPETIKFRVLY